MKNLDYCRKIKDKIKYNFKFKSSALRKNIPSVLGTIESNASGFF